MSAANPCVIRTQRATRAAGDGFRPPDSFAPHAKPVPVSEFARCARSISAKAGCPVSKLLKAEISLDAILN
jgi:hypothetical protein